MKIIQRDFGAKRFWMFRNEINETFAYPIHSHDGFHDLAYVVEGVVEQVVNGVSHSCPEGTFIFLRDRDVHSLKASPSALFYGFNVPVDVLPGLMLGIHEADAYARFTERPRFVIVPPDRRERVANELNQLFELHNGLRGQQLFFRFMLNLFVDDVFPTLEIAEHGTSHMPGWLMRLVRHIESNLEDVQSVASLSQVCGKSREHVSRNVKRFLGCSPTEYVMTLRMERAACYLAQSNRPILDICYSVGFNNPTYFYRSFKRHFGMTPLAYRNRMGDGTGLH
jgi:AraC family cel operon transcriptional repressor